MNALFESAVIWLPGLLAMAALTAASAFFSGSETALFSLSREELRRMQTGPAGERLAAALMKDSQRLLVVVLICNLLINLSFFAISLATARRLLDARLPTAAGVLSLGGLIFLILFGEVLPKSLAVVFARPAAAWASLPLTIAARILDPVLPLLAAATAALRRIFWPQLKLEPYLEVEDIERAVDTSQLGVELVRLEQQILSRILELSDMTVEEIMRPRGSYHVWKPPVHLDDLKARGAAPEVVLIAGADQDTVAQAISLYELNFLPAKHLESVAEHVAYVPWCATVSDTLSKLRSSLVSVASVVNEYGETVGIVTEDDILDTILNPQSSRGKRVFEREPVVVDQEGRILADGLTTLRHLAGQLNVNYQVEEVAPVTVAALLHDELERFPRVGDECRWQGFRFEVVQAGQPGEAIQVRVHPQADAPPSSE